MKVSTKWLQERAVEETKTGWVDGPVWRTPVMLRLEAAKKEKE